MISACSHQWIDPTVPPIKRAPLSPTIGQAPHQMREGRDYICQRCGVKLTAAKLESEYALLLVFLALAAISILPELGNTVNNVFSQSSSALTSGT